MNLCFFCGPTEEKITKEHVWPQWVSELLRGKYGSDHFIHIRSTDTESKAFKSSILDFTANILCARCNNVWLSMFENDKVKPLAAPLILCEPVEIVRPDDQWTLATWAYKMALLLEVAMPQKERSAEFFTSDERKQFHSTTLPNERVRVFIAKYKYDNHPAHAHQHQYKLTRRDDGAAFLLRITTITAGCLGLQVISVRSVVNGELVYATSEMEVELLGKAKTKIASIWPPTGEAVRWSHLEEMSQQDIEDWTEMWSKAENMFPVPKAPPKLAPPEGIS